MKKKIDKNVSVKIDPDLDKYSGKKHAPEKSEKLKGYKDSIMQAMAEIRRKRAIGSC